MRLAAEKLHGIKSVRIGKVAETSHESGGNRNLPDITYGGRQSFTAFRKTQCQNNKVYIVTCMIYVTNDIHIRDPGYIYDMSVVGFIYDIRWPHFKQPKQ